MSLVTLHIIRVVTIGALYKFFYSVGTASLKISPGQVTDQKSSPCLCMPTTTLGVLDGVLDIGEVEGDNGITIDITTQKNATETIGNPYLDGDAFCVFDYFDFTEGHMVFDNSFAADNLALFCADEREITYSYLDSCLNHLTTDAIFNYLQDEAQDHGIPIFVHHADIALSEAQALEVILAHLMGDYYYFTRGSNKPQRWKFTPQNIEHLQNYLPEKSVDNKALASIINLGRVDNLPALRHHYNGMNGMVNNKKRAKPSSYKVENTNSFHQKQDATPFKARRIKNNKIQRLA